VLDVPLVADMKKIVMDCYDYLGEDYSDDEESDEENSSHNNASRADDSEHKEIYYPGRHFRSHRQQRRDSTGGVGDCEVLRGRRWTDTSLASF
jgi:hypothetical protein